jgi:hypothetical protein
MAFMLVRFAPASPVIADEAQSVTACGADDCTTWRAGHCRAH